MTSGGIAGLPAAPPQDRRLTALIGAGALTGAGLFAYGLVSASGDDLKGLIALALLGALAERYAVGLFKSSVSVGAIAVLVAAVIGGYWGVAIVAPCTVLGGELWTSSAWYKRVYNVGVYIVCGAAFTAVFRAFDYHGLPDEWPEILVPALAGTLLNFALNTGLISAAIGLSEQRRALDVLRENYLWLLPQYFVVGLAAMAAATAYQVLGLWGLAVFAAPIAGIRHAYYLGVGRVSSAETPLARAA